MAAGKKVPTGTIVMVLLAILLLVVIACVVLAIIVLDKVHESSNTSTSGVSGNINGASQISTSDPKYGAYQNAAQFFLQAINTQADPCKDFYSYACGAWVNEDGEMSFDAVEDDNDRKQIQQILNGGYDRPVVRLRYFLMTNC
uniref:Peptidase M13 N-terminal domain-containing protein n=1 Tax=Plectus sambesii TaxID=2011161 RepID=A0A914UKU2_9BILA